MNIVWDVDRNKKVFLCIHPETDFEYIVCNIIAEMLTGKSFKNYLKKHDKETAKK